jgi:hypothetical protein
MGLMFRRRRPVARLAAGAATAGIAYRAGRRRSEQDAYNQQAAEAYSASQQVPPPVYTAPPPASTGGEVDELARLAQMHESGALTDAEFSAAKAQILGV